MKTYKQNEWIDIINKNRGGSLIINGVNLAKDFTIESLRIRTKLSGTLDAFGEISAEDITEINGNKQFVFTPDGITLLVDADEKGRFEPIMPQELENPKTIPFAKWLADYVAHNNTMHRREEDKIDSISIVGCEINHKGIIHWLNARVTWGRSYGPFGKLTTEVHLELARDILDGTYDMHRNDIVYDDWTPTCFGDYGYRAYFTNGFDIVYADDGRYTVNGKPPKSAMKVA